MGHSNLNVCATQQHYHDLWTSNELEQLAPTKLAEQGGRLADRAAWVFVGAYQGAMRQCFGQLRDHSGWSSYLVSESRDDSRAPTCMLRPVTNGVLLSGTKSWAAARTHLANLVVNATLESGDTANVLVPVNAAGVALNEKRSGRFLPELLVGSAQFEEVALPADAVLSNATTHADLFGLIEARCLLVALAGHFNEWVPEAGAPQQVLLLAGGLTTSQLGQPGSIQVLLDAMTILADWFADWVEGDEVLAATPQADHALLSEMRTRWADDRRLLQMHRPMLEKRLQSVSSGVQ